MSDSSPSSDTPSVDRELYANLKEIARAYFRTQQEGHTLQPTALAHEAYLKLSRGGAYRDRTHFLATAARAMRQVLVNHAVAKETLKRSGSGARLELDAALDVVQDRSVDVTELDVALEELEKMDARQARIVELKFFAGLTNAEVAESMKTSERTVAREWRSARAWLALRLEGRA